MRKPIAGEIWKARNGYAYLVSQNRREAASRVDEDIEKARKIYPDVTFGVTEVSQWDDNGEYLVGPKEHDLIECLGSICGPAPEDDWSE